MLCQTLSRMKSVENEVRGCRQCLSKSAGPLFLKSFWQLVSWKGREPWHISQAKTKLFSQCSQKWIQTIGIALCISSWFAFARKEEEGRNFQKQKFHSALSLYFFQSGGKNWDDSVKNWQTSVKRSHLDGCAISSGARCLANRLISVQLLSQSLMHHLSIRHEQTQPQDYHSRVLTQLISYSAARQEFAHFLRSPDSIFVAITRSAYQNSVSCIHISPRALYTLKTWN